MAGRAVECQETLQGTEERRQQQGAREPVQQRDHDLSCHRLAEGRGSPSATAERLRDQTRGQVVVRRVGRLHATR